jgi:hypothetical protein
MYVKFVNLFSVMSQLWCCVVLRVVHVVGAPTVRVGETAGDARDEELVGE